MSPRPERGTPTEALLRNGSIEAVVADPAEAGRGLDASEKHIESARTIAESDPVGAYQMTYDATRKALAAILLAHGLRGTARGGHVAVIDAAREVIDVQDGSLNRRLHSMRRMRNQAEYGEMPVSAADLVDGIATAGLTVALAREHVDRIPHV